MANGSDRSWDTPPNVQGNSACIADWDPARGLHQGQQSSERLHQQAEDKTASDPRQTSISSRAMREPSRQDISGRGRPGRMAVMRDQRANATAGLSVAGLVLPESIAYASIAGLPPFHALLAAL